MVKFGDDLCSIVWFSQAELQKAMITINYLQGGGY